MFLYFIAVPLAFTSLGAITALAWTQRQLNLIAA